MGIELTEVKKKVSNGQKDAGRVASCCCFFCNIPLFRNGRVYSAPQPLPALDQGATSPGRTNYPSALPGPGGGQPDVCLNYLRNRQ